MRTAAKGFGVSRPQVTECGGAGSGVAAALRDRLVDDRPHSRRLARQASAADSGRRAGVGYELDVPMSTFYNLPATGDRVTLLTHLIVREDAHLLYGFATEGERARLSAAAEDDRSRRAHGARGALGHDRRRAAEAVTLQETGRLTRIPGIGKKDRGAAAARVERQARRRRHDHGRGESRRARRARRRARARSRWATARRKRLRR